MQMVQHQGPNGPPGPQQVGPPPAWAQGPPSAQMAHMNEAVWLQIGEQFGNEQARTEVLTRIRQHPGIDGQL